MRSTLRTGWAFLSRDNLRARVECIEGPRMPADSDREMAGAPAHSSDTMPATEEDFQLAPRPQVVGNPAHMGNLRRRSFAGQPARRRRPFWACSL
eukprot:7025259-Pyramimonas_sp.AAC.1